MTFPSVVDSVAEENETEEVTIRQPRETVELLTSTFVLHPLRFLTTLTGKPSTLDCALVYHGWQLLLHFAQFRPELEEYHGQLPRARWLVRVPQLMADHPVPPLLT